MKHRKYWGGRLRRLGDVVAGTAAAVAVVATGYAQGPALAEILPYVAGTLKLLFHVAGLNQNRWRVWTGMGGCFRVEYAPHRPLGARHAGRLGVDAHVGWQEFKTWRDDPHHRTHTGSRAARSYRCSQVPATTWLPGC